jgi:hypothetical protein
MAVIPEVLNRESIFFKKLRAPGFPPLPTVGALSTGMTTFYEFINRKIEKMFSHYTKDAFTVASSFDGIYAFFFSDAISWVFPCRPV